MKLKALALAATLAIASVPSLALTTDLGVLDGDTEGVGNFFPTGSTFFSDTFTFQLLSTQTVSGGALSNGIGSFALVLLNSSLNPVQTDTTPTTFSFANLTAGTYALNFVGFGAAAPSFYGGSVTAVPEPETYALMLAGLGVIGFIAGRRRERV